MHLRSVIIVVLVAVTTVLYETAAQSSTWATNPAKCSSSSRLFLVRDAANSSALASGVGITPCSAAGTFTVVTLEQRLLNFSANATDFHSQRLEVRDGDPATPSPRDWFHGIAATGEQSSKIMRPEGCKEEDSGGDTTGCLLEADPVPAFESNLTTANGMQSVNVGLLLAPIDGRRTVTFRLSVFVDFLAFNASEYGTTPPEQLTGGDLFLVPNATVFDLEWHVAVKTLYQPPATLADAAELRPVFLELVEISTDGSVVDGGTTVTIDVGDSRWGTPVPRVAVHEHNFGACNVALPEFSFLSPDNTDGRISSLVNFTVLDCPLTWGDNGRVGNLNMVSDAAATPVVWSDWAAELPSHVVRSTSRASPTGGIPLSSVVTMRTQLEMTAGEPQPALPDVESPPTIASKCRVVLGQYCYGVLAVDPDAETRTPLTADSWEAARDACWSRGGDLPAVSLDDLKELVRSYRHEPQHGAQVLRAEPTVDQSLADIDGFWIGQQVTLVDGNYPSEDRRWRWQVTGPTASAYGEPPISPTTATPVFYSTPSSEDITADVAQFAVKDVEVVVTGYAPTSETRGFPADMPDKPVYAAMCQFPCSSGATELLVEHVCTKPLRVSDVERFEPSGTSLDFTFNVSGYPTAIASQLEAMYHDGNWFMSPPVLRTSALRRECHAVVLQKGGIKRMVSEGEFSYAVEESVVEVRCSVPATELPANRSAFLCVDVALDVPRVFQGQVQIRTSSQSPLVTNRPQGVPESDLPAVIAMRSMIGPSLTVHRPADGAIDISTQRFDAVGYTINFTLAFIDPPMQGRDEFYRLEINSSSVHRCRRREWNAEDRENPYTLEVMCRVCRMAAGEGETSFKLRLRVMQRATLEIIAAGGNLVGRVHVVETVGPTDTASVTITPSNDVTLSEVPSQTELVSGSSSHSLEVSASQTFPSTRTGEMTSSESYSGNTPTFTTSATLLLTDSESRENTQTITRTLTPSFTVSTAVGAVEMTAVGGLVSSVVSVSRLTNPGTPPELRSLVVQARNDSFRPAVDIAVPLLASVIIDEVPSPFALHNFRSTLLRNNNVVTNYTHLTLILNTVPQYQTPYPQTVRVDLTRPRWLSRGSQLASWQLPPTNQSSLWFNITFLPNTTSPSLHKKRVYHNVAWVFALICQVFGLSTGSAIVDQQVGVAMGLTSCAVDTHRYSATYTQRALSPITPHSTDVVVSIVMDIVLVGAVSTASAGVYAFYRFLLKWESYRAAVRARFPGFGFGAFSAIWTGLAFYGIRILSGHITGHGLLYPYPAGASPTSLELVFGIIAAALTLGTPLAVQYFYARASWTAQFRDYVSMKHLDDWVVACLPVGCWGPAVLTHRFGQGIVDLRPRTVLISVSLLFAFPFLQLLAYAPLPTSLAGCGSQAVMSIAVTSTYVGFLIIFRPYRSMVMNFSAIVAKIPHLIVAIDALQRASTDKMHTELADQALAAQSIITIARCAIAVFSEFCEGFWLRAITWPDDNVDASGVYHHHSAKQQRAVHLSHKNTCTESEYSCSHLSPKRLALSPAATPRSKQSRRNTSSYDDRDGEIQKRCLETDHALRAAPADDGRWMEPLVPVGEEQDFKYVLDDVFEEMKHFSVASERRQLEGGRQTSQVEVLVGDSDAQASLLEAEMGDVGRTPVNTAPPVSRRAKALKRLQGIMDGL